MDARYPALPQLPVCHLSACARFAATTGLTCHSADGCGWTVLRGGVRKWAHVTSFVCLQVRSRTQTSNSGNSLILV